MDKKAAIALLPKIYSNSSRYTVKAASAIVPGEVSVKPQ
jgi:hypothetical protein